MINKYIDTIEYEELYVSEVCDTITLYFTVSAEILRCPEILSCIGKDFPDAVFAEILIEFPYSDHVYFSAKDVSLVGVSPLDENLKSYLNGGCYEINLPYEDINMLLDIYTEAREKGE